jgi:hypothetical protein
MVPTLADLLPRRSPIAWQRHLAVAGDVPFELDVSQRWTGVIVEVLSLPTGRLFLDKNGSIRDHIEPDGRTYRTVFLTAAEARHIAAQLPLAILGTPGTDACRFTAATVSLPPWPGLAAWLDNIEREVAHV